MQLKDFISKFARWKDRYLLELKPGMDGVVRDWKKKAIPVTPLDTGNLRAVVKTEVTASAHTLKGSLTADAFNKNFNYGYYIHEQDAGGRRLRYPGTIKKFLDRPLEQNERDFMGKMEKELEKAWHRL